MKKDISKLKRNTGIHFKIGLILALSFSLWAFNITTERDAYGSNHELDIMEEVIENQPITAHKKKPIPPPPTVEINDNIEPIEDPEFIEEPEPEKTEPSMKPISETTIKRTPTPPVIAKPKAPVQAPPPIVEEPIEEPDEIVIFAEQMPVFTSSCIENTIESERKTCSDNAIMSFISKNLKYPAIARENGIQGTVVLSFVVDKDGSLIDKKIIREIGGGCGQEAMRILDKMNSWIPGKQNARPVKVRFNLPIKFKLK